MGRAGQRHNNGYFACAVNHKPYLFYAANQQFQRNYDFAVFAVLPCGAVAINQSYNKAYARHRQKRVFYIRALSSRYRLYLVHLPCNAAGSGKQIRHLNLMRRNAYAPHF